MALKDSHTKYIFEKERLESFQGKWKPLKGFKNCTPSSLAAAGFYYAGTESVPDNVKCFVCLKELGDWEKEDDPWEEHKKRGANCMFIQLSNKPEMSLQDFFQLFYEVKKNFFLESVYEKKNILNEKQESSMEAVKNPKRKRGPL